MYSTYIHTYVRHYFHLHLPSQVSLSTMQYCYFRYLCCSSSTHCPPTFGAAKKFELETITGMHPHYIHINTNDGKGFFYELIILFNRHQTYSWDDPYGPVILTVLLILALMVQFVFKVAYVYMI